MAAPAPPALLNLLTLPVEIQRLIFAHAMRRDDPIVIRGPHLGWSTAPASIRNRVHRLDAADVAGNSQPLYDAVLSVRSGIAVPSPGYPGRATHHTALLLVSQAVYREAQSFLYTENMILFDDAHSGFLWLAARGASALKLLRDLTFWMSPTMLPGLWTNTLDLLVRLLGRSRQAPQRELRVTLLARASNGLLDTQGIHQWADRTQPHMLRGLVALRNQGYETGFGFFETLHHGLAAIGRV